MELATTRPLRDKYLDYIKAVHIDGLTKKAAYLQHVDPNCKPESANQRILAMEKKSEFQAIYDVIMSDANAQFAMKITNVRNKFIGVVEKNLDTVDAVLNDVKTGTVREKATAVRLVNETVQAMSAVATPTQSMPGTGNVDPSGVIS